MGGGGRRSQGKFYPYKKGGRKSIIHEGGTTRFEVVLIFEVSAMLKGGGGAKKCPSF